VTPAETFWAAKLELTTGAHRSLAPRSPTSSLRAAPKCASLRICKRTIDWRYKTKDRDEVKRIFTRMLTER
jgi:hypothetical protein